MLRIRAEEPGDIPYIRLVNTAAFGGPAEAALVDALRTGDAFIPDLSLVAEIRGQVVGHILFTPVVIRSDDHETPALSLAPVAVLPDFQRLGIGSRLVEEGLARARILGHRLVIVVGHPGYYPRFGFLPARPQGLSAPFPVPDEAFMVCELAAGALAGAEGTVVYPPPFDEVA
jgi:putative acetyltransferase